jgi:predicted TIM-barrel fold metal-dependent hydrolase
MTVPIAGPDPHPEPIRTAIPPGACDCHAHIFGPNTRFPYAEGRGYTPPDAPLEKHLAMLDALGMARGVVVQGNAHGYDNRAILDAVAREPDRLRGVAITDLRVPASELKQWHAQGIRALRFHVFHSEHRPAYVRGVGLDVWEAFKPAMLALGWHAQIWCDWRVLPELREVIRGMARDMPVVIDHMAAIDAGVGPGHPSFQALLELLGEGACWVKVSGAYRCSKQFPDYPDARPLHEALLRANPDQLIWGTDWPHPQVDAAIMPNDGRLLNLFCDWTPSAELRTRILVRNPEKLYGFPPA